MTLMHIVQRNLSRIFERIICYTLVFIITPCYFGFEMTVVRPTIVREYQLGIMKHLLHVVCSTFCFINVVGNMILSIATDTTLKETTSADSYCEECKTPRPQSAWHCTQCNVCVLRRDHHCYFFSRCIGLYNQRYYVIYLQYIFISLLYSIYYNYFYVLTKFDGADIILSAFRVINPFIRYTIPEPLGIKDLYVWFLMLNAGLLTWSGGLFSFHMKNVLKGVTTHEVNIRKRGRSTSMKQNLQNVFGLKWYWAMLWPFAISDIPKECKSKAV